MPSTEYVNREIDTIYGKDGLKVDPSIIDCMKNQVKKKMDTLVVPYNTHTVKSDNTAANRVIVKDERQNYRDNNKGNDRTLEEQSEYEAKEMEKAVDEKMEDGDCKKKIKEELEFFKDLPDNYFQDLFDNAKKHCQGGSSAPAIQAPIEMQYDMWGTPLVI
jgi:hypothetical protein